MLLRSSVSSVSSKFFSNFGAAVCDVRFERQQCEGCRVAIRPRDVLGEKLDKWRIWRMQHTEHVRQVTGELCAVLGRGEDLRVTARCGSARDTFWHGPYGVLLWAAVGGSGRWWAVVGGGGRWWAVHCVHILAY